MACLQGLAGTGGSFDEPLYRYAISPEAQEANNAEAILSPISFGPGPVIIPQPTKVPYTPVEAEDSDGELL